MRPVQTCRGRAQSLQFGKESVWGGDGCGCGRRIGLPWLMGLCSPGRPLSRRGDPILLPPAKRLRTASSFILNWRRYLRETQAPIHSEISTNNEVLEAPVSGCISEAVDLY